MSDVTFQHAEYVKNLPYWQKLDDVCEGEDAVKAKGEKYLPMPNAHDKRSLKVISIKKHSTKWAVASNIVM
ncbi:hypothetical protein MTT06_18955 [Acinetobacter baumannii]|uniref:hypothetical protein n=1 Tax=Acinetobacter baumannii TaxID=470 RepID=UPI0024B0F8FB|nr:hypothetical protein [Acinetobacter baumannii]WFT65193.1 hypothetical protein MTT06_18955 [Acinetobacter baumannii]HCA5072096.1 hypothetical protein [Acinetobacter baumannii]